MAFASNFSQFGARVVLSPFVLAMAATFGASKGQIGAVLTLLWASFAVFQFPSGVLADRYGERRVIVAALSLTALGSAFAALAPSLLAFVGAVLVLGVGAGLYFSVGSALLARLFDRTGQVLGLHSAGGPLAGVAFPVAATAVAAHHGWRAGVALGALVAVATLLLVFRYVVPTPPTSPEIRLRDRLTVRTVASLLSRPDVAFTTALGVLGMYAFQSFVSFFPTFLIEHHGLDEGVASTLFSVVFVLFAVCLPLVGRIGDAVDVDAAIAGSMLVAAIGLAVVIVAPSTPILLAGIVVLGSGFTWGGALQARFMNALPADRRGTGFGLVRTVFVLLGSAGNAVTGWLAETGSWSLAFGVVVGVLLLGASLTAVNRLLAGRSPARRSTPQ